MLLVMWRMTKSLIVFNSPNINYIIIIVGKTMTSVIDGDLSNDDFSHSTRNNYN